MSNLKDYLCIDEIDTGYTPVNCLELKAAHDMYDHYYDYLKTACINANWDRMDRYDNILYVLSNRIDKMEEALLNEYEQIKPIEKEENLQ